MEPLPGVAGFRRAFLQPPRPAEGPLQPWLVNEFQQLVAGVYTDAWHSHGLHTPESTPHHWQHQQRGWFGGGAAGWQPSSSTPRAGNRSWWAPPRPETPWSASWGGHHSNEWQPSLHNPPLPPPHEHLEQWQHSHAAWGSGAHGQESLHEAEPARRWPNRGERNPFWDETHRESSPPSYSTARGGPWEDGSNPAAVHPHFESEQSGQGTGPSLAVNDVNIHTDGAPSDSEVGDTSDAAALSRAVPDWEGAGEPNADPVTHMTQQILPNESQLPEPERSARPLPSGSSRPSNEDWAAKKEPRPPSSDLDSRLSHPAAATSVGAEEVKALAAAILEDDPAPTTTTDGNLFPNDGSFMERYLQAMAKLNAGDSAVTTHPASTSDSFGETVDTADDASTAPSLPSVLRYSKAELLQLKASGSARIPSSASLGVLADLGTTSKKKSKAKRAKGGGGSGSGGNTAAATPPPLSTDAAHLVAALARTAAVSTVPYISPTAAEWLDLNASTKADTCQEEGSISERGATPPAPSTPVQLPFASLAELRRQLDTTVPAGGGDLGAVAAVLGPRASATTGDGGDKSVGVHVQGFEVISPLSWATCTEPSGAPLADLLARPHPPEATWLGWCFVNHGLGVGLPPLSSLPTEWDSRCTVLVVVDAVRSDLEPQCQANGRLWVECYHPVTLRRIDFAIV